MTIQLSQIQSPESSLLPDQHTLYHTDNSFQQRLEEEQRRIGSMFSPFSQFNFNSWFGYADLSLKTNSTSRELELFSDSKTEIKSFENYEPRSGELNQSQAPMATQTSNSLIRSPQAVLQELLTKSGWLTPNLEILPLFFRAHLEGKFLGKLDLQLLIDQIVSQLKVVKEKGRVQLTVGLKPESLEEILMTITSRSGMISIQIQAPEETRKLIESQLSELELALKKVKVHLAEIKITDIEEVNNNA